MKRFLYLLLLLCLQAAIAVGSFFIYLYSFRNTNAVPSSYWAGFLALAPHEVRYAVSESDSSCLQAYQYIKQTTSVHFIQDKADSRYSMQDNLVYLTNTAVLYDTVEAAHEYGHALDRYLYGQDFSGYFSRQPSFSQAYASDCRNMQTAFSMDSLFRTQAYRNLAVSDILFAVFYNDYEYTDALIASYTMAGAPYWRHEDDYMAGLTNRQTEVFANLFSILLSDDEAAKNFLETYFPTCKEEILCSIKAKKW